MIAHSYSSIYKLPTTGLRFSQYMDLGEGLIWLYSNSQKYYSGKPIQLFNMANMSVIFRILMMWYFIFYL